MMKAYDEIFWEGGGSFYQEKEGFRFGHDAILLADFIVEFAKVQQKNLEIGTGNGILPVLLSQRGFVSKEYCAVDILESNIELAEKNAEKNGVYARFVCQDIRNFSEKNAYAQIFANPPYMKRDGKLQNINSNKAVARHEICLTLEEFIRSVKKILAPIGALYMVYRSHRLQELFEKFMKYGFYVSKIQFVYHQNGRVSNLVLLEVYKGKKGSCSILAPKYIK
ncbi:tRNA1(Val) (adenine(37)-N6)-methyltransferase [Fusobacterium necrophorum]|nr:methyltransferase [Fusobacterium necrophorum]MBR8734178.1 tRNA1(Val) (adenine(37)-N6)-methyltransferase [Fusobacterium necrophorum]MBR8790354.1 tRNA1(Val) (adenine(37)-N6)-methyltransferase [Fusobacterium necrophorum]MCF0162366.1 methyltransferase [Fusobacterium necrophorum]